MKVSALADRYELLSPGIPSDNNCWWDYPEQPADVEFLRLLMVEDYFELSGDYDMALHARFIRLFYPKVLNYHQPNLIGNDNVYYESDAYQVIRKRLSGDYFLPPDYEIVRFIVLSTGVDLLTPFVNQVFDSEAPSLMN